MKRLSELLAGTDYTLSGVTPDVKISIPVSDSREAVANSLFICINGTRRNGENYAGDAVSAGAVACISERILPRLPCAAVPDVRCAAAHIWNNYYNHPSENMRLFGITGTSGKTSTSFFLKSILEHSGRKTGLIGSCGCYIGQRRLNIPGGETADIPAQMTTPDPKWLYGALSEMRNEGVTDAVIEVSSHAVYQHKTDALRFDYGIYTNLSPEHLDLHRDMDSYFAVKKTFLDNCDTVIYNRDDAYSDRFGKEKCYGYGADNAKAVRCDLSGVAYTLKYKDKTVCISTPVSGSFNLYNTMAAAAAAMCAGVVPQQPPRISAPHRAI